MQTPADSLGAGGVHGIGGTRRGAGDGFRFSYIEIPPPAPQFAGVQPVERRTLFMRRSLLSCAVRRAPPSLRGSLHAEPNFPYSVLSAGLDVHGLPVFAPAPGRRYRLPSGACVHKAQQCRYSILPCNTVYTARPARHGDTIGAMVRIITAIRSLTLTR